MQQSDQVQLVHRPTLISAPTTMVVPAGRSIAGMVADLASQAHTGVVMVDVDGVPVPRARWETTIPAAGAHVMVWTRVHGDDKNPLAIVLSIVVIAVATVYGGPLGAAIGFKGATAAFIGGTLITTAGSLLINAIAPTRTPKATNYTYDDSPTYALSGARNQATPWGPVPVLLGTHRCYPPLGANYYTRIEGQDEYLYLLVVWACNPITIGDLYVGDTLLDEYDAEYQSINGLPGQANTLALFPNQVTQASVGTALTYADGWVTRSAEANCDEIGFEIWFPTGLAHVSQHTGKRSLLEVKFEVQYRVIGASTWTEIESTVSYDAQNFGVTLLDLSGGQWHEGKNSLYAHPDGRIVSCPGVRDRQFLRRICQYHLEMTYDEISGHTLTISNVVNVSPRDNTTGLICSLSGNEIAITAGTATFDGVICEAKSIEVQRFAWKFPVDSSESHEIRIRRVTTDYDDDDYRFADSTWQYLRSFTNDAPLNFSVPVAATAVRIKATDQLSGVVDNLNAVCSSLVPVWDDVAEDWNTWEASNNPAALYRYVIKDCLANPRRRTFTQIESDALEDWYEWCEDNGYAFNMYRDFKTSVQECLGDIVSAGMASVAMPNGKWSVVVDRFDKAIAQHFTPRNSWNFSGEKIFFEPPHAVRVKFKNENQGYEWDERIVYADGYTSATATLFEQWEFPGITDPDLIWIHARRRMAQALLRPEAYSIYVDFERLACSRGDLVRVAHDVPMWGTASGRVKSLVAGEDEYEGRTVGVVLDEYVTMEAGKSYSCRFRRVDADDTSLLISVTTVAGETNTLTFALDPPIVDSFGPQVGELAMFGETDSESAECLVYSIESIDDLAAKITLVDYAPAIDDADSGTIPAFTTGITGAVDATSAPPKAQTLNIESGTRALEVTGNIIRPRIIIDLAPVASGSVRVVTTRVRYRIYGTQVPWTYLDVKAPAASIVLSDVVEDETYSIQVQHISFYGTPGEWSDPAQTMVLGQAETPSDVEDFRIEIVGTTAYFSWDAVADLDLSGYKIRFTSETSGAEWSSANTVLDNIPATAVSASLPARQGTYLIKAIDRGGRESENASSVINAYGDIMDMNVVEVLLEDSDFTGTHDLTEVSGEVLRLSDTSGVLEVDESAMVVDDAAMVLDDGAAAIDLTVGYYYFANALDLLDVYTCRLTAEVVAGGVDLLANLFAREDFFGVDEFFGDSPGNWNVKVQVRTTPDDPAGTPTWSDWRTFSVGDFTFRKCELRARLESLATGISPGVVELDVVVDMPDRHIAGEDQVCTIAGLRVNFSPAFLGFSGIGFAYQDMDTGDYALVSNKSETGFDINFYDSADTPVERTFDFVAKGYGRKVTV